MFIEVVLAVLIIGAGVMVFATVMLHDMKAITDNRYDTAARTVARKTIEYNARFSGWNNLPTSSPTPITDPELAAIPGASGQLFIDNFNGNSKVKRVTAVVTVPHNVNNGVRTRTWRLVTLVSQNGFDKSN